MKFKMGVFQIRNTLNNKIFIGGSINLVAIWNRQRFQLNAGSHANIELQTDWIEFGEENFVYEILSEIKQDDTTSINYRREVKALAEMFIQKLQPFGQQGYHLRKK